MSNLDIKKLLNEKNVILAPMAGITSFSYRKLFKKVGIGLVYSEMISDCGLIYGNQETNKLLYTDNKESPLAIQLFGGEKDNIVKAIGILESKNINYDFLDINLGCPVYKVCKGNGGSSWLRDLNKLSEMMTAVCKASTKPVLAKIRLGWDDNHINVYETVKVLEDSGVKMIAIHPRTTKQGYCGVAHYDQIIDIRKYTTLPIVVSGDIFSIDDYIRVKNLIHPDGFMIARGGLGNPKLITDIYNYEKNGIINYERIYLEQKEFLLSFMEDLIKEKGEVTAIKILRGIAPKFFSYFQNSKSLRKELSSSIVFADDVKNILKKYEYEFI